MNAPLQLLRRTLPAVVHVKAAIPEEHPSAPLLGSEREGTGTFVDREGHILTANYVVIGAQAITVRRASGETLVADVAGRDYATGLALLRVPEGSADSLAVGSSSALEPGDEIFLVGSGGDDGPRVTTGAVSDLGAFDAYWEYRLDRAILTTAMNPGLGGGPLCDRSGRMVGVVALSLNEIGRLSMAIPAEYYLERRDDLVLGKSTSRPRRAWIGLFATTLHEHVVVAGLVPGGPGEIEGLRAGDVVLSVDGVPVSSRVSLYRQIWTHASGDRVSFKIFRNNQVRTLDITSRSVEETFA